MRQLSSFRVSWRRFAFAAVISVAAAAAQPFAYVSNQSGNNVSVVNLANNTIPAYIYYSGGGLAGMAMTPNGSYLYVAAQAKASVVVMSTASNSVITAIPVGTNPTQVAITPDGTQAYVINQISNSVSVINTATNTVTATIPVGTKPAGVAITPDGTKVLVPNLLSNNISVIGTASNTVLQTWAASPGASGIAMSPDGSVAYVANQYANSLTFQSTTNGSVLATVSNLSGPNAVAVSPNGACVYVTNANNSTLSVINISSAQVVASVGLGSLPTSVTVSADNSTVYVTNGNSYSLSIISAASNTVTATISHVGIYPYSVVLSGSAPVPASITTSAGDGQSAFDSQVFPTQLAVLVADNGGKPVSGAAVNFTVVPGPNGAGGSFASTPAMPIITGANGIATAPVLTANGAPGTFNVTAGVGALTATFTLTNIAPTYALGAGAATVGSAAGSGTVLLSANTSWTASSNAPWLQLAGGSASGAGNAVVQFSYSANLSSNPQTATLTIAGLPFTVTQAGASFTPVTSMTGLVTSGLNNPQGVAVDGQGNVYIADTANNAIKEWNAATQQVTTLVSSGLNAPASVAVDASGNLYVADTANNAIKKWTAGNQQVTTLVSAGLSAPSAVVVDSSGNVYIADTGNNSIREWIASTQQVTTLAGASGPAGIAVDALANVYFANTANNTIAEWNAVTRQVTTLVSSGLNAPIGVAVDGDGNLDFADTFNNAVKQWYAASQQVTTLAASGLSSPAGVAVDRQGNQYIADRNNNTVRKLTLAYLSLGAASRTEGAAAGTDSVAYQVLPAGTAVTVTSDQSWLTITGTDSGMISFSFPANTNVAARTGHVTVLGQAITVTQVGDVAASMNKSAGDGQSTMVGQVFPTALAVNVQDGRGGPVQGAAVTFTVIPGADGAAAAFASTPAMPLMTDQNGNAITPVLTANGIAGTFTVTASVGTLTVTFALTNIAPPSYALAASSTTVGSAAGAATVLLIANGSWSASSNAAWLRVSTPTGSGSALIQFSYTANSNSAPQSGTLTIAGLTFTVTQAGAGFVPATSVISLVTSGLNKPQGVAVDAQGNLYIADTSDNAIKEWSAATQQVTTLFSGLNAPNGVAIDGSGNIYVADTGNNAIKEWVAASQQVVTLVSSGLISPSGIAVDGQGNVYFSDTGHNAIKEWVANTQLVSTLVSSGLSGPRGVALDVLNNVYIADTKNNAIKEWNQVNGQVITLVSSGLNAPFGVAVDGAGNVDIADTGNNAIKQWSPATQQVRTLIASGLKAPSGAAADGQGNIYFADKNSNAIKKAAAAFLSLSVTSKTEGSHAGTDSVGFQVLPAGTPVTATSSQSWLKIAGTSGGSISFSFLANVSITSRTAQISVMGAAVTVTQSGAIPAIISKIAGNRQSTTEGQAFATALEVKVKDLSGSPVSNVPVIFTVVPGLGGASGTFSLTPPMPILTNSSGYATAPALTANSVAGNFTVVAAAGVLITTFNLTVTAP